jgi:hypothetical protein
MGFTLIRLYTKATKFNYKIDFSLINLSRLKSAIIFFIFAALITFVIESVFVFPPFLSKTPTRNYMNFGLPLIHHFVGLLTFNSVLTLLYLKITGKRKYFFINLFFALVLYFLIMARLMILNVLVVSFITYFIVFSIKIRAFTIFKIVISCVILFYGFIILGDLRLGGIGEDYIYYMTKVNFNQVPPSLAFPYIYITVGIQNTINVIENYEQIYFGGLTVTNLLPLVKIEHLTNSTGLIEFQVQEGLTTFIMGTKDFLDFHLLSPIFSFIKGVIVSIIYIKAKTGRLSYLFFFLSFIFPLSLMSFFSDVMFNSTFTIYALVSFFTVKYIQKIKE